jgi:hypothetical protein
MSSIQHLYADARVLPAGPMHRCRSEAGAFESVF